MPPAIAAFAAWAAISVAAAYAIVAVVVISAGMAVYGAAQARRAERDARNAMNAGMRDRLVTRVATEAPHRIIYGRAKVGSDVVAMFTSGAKDEFKHIVCVHAAHECDAIEEIYVNNVAVGYSSLSVEGDASAGRFAADSQLKIIEENFTGPSFTISRAPISTGSVRAFTGSGAAMSEVAVTSVVGRVVTVGTSAPVTVSYQYYEARKFGATLSQLTSTPKSPTVRVRGHLGGASDTADSYLMTAVPGKWASTAVLRGMCYTIITLDLNAPEFQGGLVPIHALIRGKKLYDPRTSTTAWSQNPALAIYDYLTSKYCGVAAGDLPVAQFIAAANVCDEASNIGSEKKYTINGSLSSDQNPTDVLESMSQCMAGGLVSTTWDVFAGKYIAPVAALSQDDIVGGMQITPGASDASIYNGVKGQYISSENKYVMTDFKPYQNGTYRASDARDLYTNIDFPFTDSLQRVTNLARIFTEDQRNGFTIKAEFSLKAWPRKVGERITFTSSFLGQTAKVYRITDKSYSPNSAVQLTLKEDAASIWDFADATVLDSTPNTDLPDPWTIADLASLSCTSGEATLLRQADGTMVPRIRVTWPAPATQAVFVGGEIQIEWRALTSSTWEKAVVTGDQTEAYLSPITPGYFYAVRARCVNTYLNNVSNWTYTLYQVQVYEAWPTVYKWASSAPAVPSGAASYAWGSATFGAAPSGWSLTTPAAPTTGPDVSLWQASVRVSDITNTTTAFAWSDADITTAGYSVAAANAAIVAAQASATSALNAITAISSDDVLSKGEKSQLILDAAAIDAEVADIRAKADALSVSRSAYDVAYAAVGAYLATLGSTSTDWSNATIDTTIVGSTFRAKFVDYYTAKVALLNAITVKLKALADAAQGQANTATTNAATAQTTANTAASDATAALTAITSISSDNVLSKGEKSQLILDAAAIDAEVADIRAKADALSVSRSAYDAAYAAVGAYLATLGSTSADWSNTTIDTTIVGSTFRGKFVDYYTAKVALLNTIAAKAATLATWGNVSGDGKPMNYATVGPADAATSMGFNPQFNDWPTGQTYPTGWASWGGVTPVKETTVVRTAPFAVKYTLAAATDNGSLALSDFHNTPLGTGVYIRGSYDAYIINNAGGTGKPGYMFRLYTNSALTTYRDTIVPVTRNDVTGWQRVPFSAQVNASEQIYGIQIFQMACWSGMPGGAWSVGSSVAFDNLTFDVVTPTDISQIKYDNFSVALGGITAGSYGPYTNGTTQTIGTKTSTVTGGTAPYSYNWSVTSEGYDGLPATCYASGGTSGSSITVKASGTNMWQTPTFTLVVTDANGRTCTAGSGTLVKFGSYTP